MRKRALALKTLLESVEPCIMPGCGDALSAHLIGEAGFGTGFISGASVAAAQLALPDMDILTFVEMLDSVRRILMAAPEVLWLADADTGYGNELAVQRTIRNFANAGVAAVLIEDKVWPRPHGTGGAKCVVDLAAARTRCRAAVEACREQGVLLLARTDARSSLGFEKAMARISVFAEEGADLLFLDSPKSETEVREFVKACGSIPAVAVHSQAPLSDAQLAEAGVKLILHPYAVLATTVHYVRDALRNIKNGTTGRMADQIEMSIATRREVFLKQDARWALQKGND
ncbi:2-methylisocitrate lyase-like PEP mutase family enzyme [Bradyrhizobium macuxiense]|uniref:2-methylisocitrate lyase-like PEP mutase family enzyme n=1 Tax=Bradyrhizobium macuxiense TaxID=1755647 RepID=A0A560KX32_9BRAD|nr:isocitrate lyase/PEP mutase family protein [Bradyrhizobium macuxiense]TWB87798.1 2-methylisocitrate lyase-like PEP mutase family enzyme [Bradyrhizobium macuxiense]